LKGRALTDVKTTARLMTTKVVKYFLLKYTGKYTLNHVKSYPNTKHITRITKHAGVILHCPQSSQPYFQTRLAIIQQPFTVAVLFGRSFLGKFGNSFALRRIHGMRYETL